MKLQSFSKRCGGEFDERVTRIEGPMIEVQKAARKKSLAMKLKVTLHTV